jgi:ADP-ribose pyrophosphatase YjhB (NUDIX family)
MVHGAARARRGTTTVSELRIRPAARAVLLDPDDRILLVRFEFPARRVWATVGGGIEPGETAEDAIRRELEEEAGLTEFELGPAVWTRLHVIPFIGGAWDGQQEQYHLVRTPAFEPHPRLSWEQLNREYVFELRWWTVEELEEAAPETSFAPTQLPELLRMLLRDGPPTEPLDVGV